MLPCPPGRKLRTEDLATFVSFLGVRGKGWKRDQWDQMASRAKGIISYSMDFGGYVDMSVYRYIGMSVCRYFGISVYRYIDMSIYRYIRESVYRYIGISVYRCIGISVDRRRYVDMSIYLAYVDMSVYRYIGISVY